MAELITDTKIIKECGNRDHSFVILTYDHNIPACLEMTSFLESLETKFPQYSFYQLNVNLVADPKELEMVPNFIPALIVYSSKTKQLRSNLGVLTKEQMENFINE